MDGAVGTDRLANGRQMGGYKPRKLDPHRDFLEAARAEKSIRAVYAIGDQAPSANKVVYERIGG